MSRGSKCRTRSGGIRGTPAFGLTGKDIILRTLGDLGRNTVAMERSVNIAARRSPSLFRTCAFNTIANMTAEFGGLKRHLRARCSDGGLGLPSGPDSVDAGGLSFSARTTTRRTDATHDSLDAWNRSLRSRFRRITSCRCAQHVGHASSWRVHRSACTTTEEERSWGRTGADEALRRGIV